ncbi:hypothetical protein sos41_10030 [Alphaproteobacteria bacterium SO-S41]|nr:hypothetical protein sos41_10030 [Alphaproteobacteria bacterium SO-S41]
MHAALEPSSHTGWRWTAFIAAVWLVLVAASLILRGEKAIETWPDPDDAMRIVEVRDFLNGQAWHDLTQHRLDPTLPPSDGVSMHWSRLIDAPIAGIVLALTPLVGAERAEQTAILIWPLLPALLLLPAAGFIGGRIAGRDGAILAVIATAFAAFTVTVYAPARIDHHNMQIALGVALIAALTSEGRTRASFLAAGLFSGLALTIGMETLPYVALGGMVIALRWALDGVVWQQAFRDYAAAFALTATAGLVLNAPPALWLLPACDVVSPVYLAPLILAAGIASLGGAVVTGRGGRLIIVALAAGAAVAAVALQNPVCLKGPYAAVDPRLFAVWMDHIREARSAFDLFAANPIAFAGVFALPLAALAAVAFMGTQPARIAGLTLAIAIAIALWQVRSLPFAAVLAAPVLAAAAARAARRAQSLPQVGRLAIGAALSNPVLITLAASIVAGLVLPLSKEQQARRASTAETDCLRRSDYRALAALPPGLVLSNIAFGPLILAETPHSVIAAPYHRNRDGILDAVAMLTAAPDEARALIRARGIDYVAICAASGALDTQLAGHPDALFIALRNGQTPDWLTRVPDSGNGGTWVYRVTSP